MNRVIATILICFSFYSTNVTAEGVCATAQCEIARKIPDLPADVESFANKRDGCDHFRGEPWPEGDAPWDRERREFILNNINELCTGSDRVLEGLRNKYHHDEVIIKLLHGYEDKIEFN